MACQIAKINGWIQESVAGTDSFQHMNGRRDVSASLVTSSLEDDSAPDKARLKEFVEKLEVLKGATYKLLGMDHYSIKKYTMSESPKIKKIILQSVYQGQNNNKYKTADNK